MDIGKRILQDHLSLSKKEYFQFIKNSKRWRTINNHLLAVRLEEGRIENIPSSISKLLSKRLIIISLRFHSFNVIIKNSKRWRTTNNHLFDWKKEE